MRNTMILGCLGMTTLLVFARVLTSSAADSATNDAAQDSGSQAAIPGPAHRAFARREGEYTIVHKVRKDPNGPLEESTGQSRIRSLLGGRFLLEESSGMMFGQPFTVVRQTGYNNASQNYEATWTYSRSTAMMFLTGQSDDGGKTIRWKGTWNNEHGVRQTLFAGYEDLTENQFVLRVYSGPRDGSEFVVAETIYTRRE